MPGTMKERQMRWKKKLKTRVKFTTGRNWENDGEKTKKEKKKMRRKDRIQMIERKK